MVVQSDALPLSTLLVAPTSTAAQPASFRPEVVIAGRPTRVLVEQTTAVDPSRLGETLEHLDGNEIIHLDRALSDVFGLAR